MTIPNRFKILPNAEVSNLYFVDSNQKNGQCYQYIDQISACPHSREWLLMDEPIYHVHGQLFSCM